MAVFRGIWTSTIPLLRKAPVGSIGSLRSPQNAFRALSSESNPIERAASMLWSVDEEDEHAQKLKSLVNAAEARHASMLEQLSKGSLTLGPKEGREFNELTTVTTLAEQLASLTQEVNELLSVMAESKDDEEMYEMAKAEHEDLVSKRKPIAVKLLQLLLQRSESDEDAPSGDGAILEVRAGTGGDEAALFAGELFDMYTKFARAKGWSTEVIAISKGDIGGVKEAVLGIKDPEAFSKLRWESGGHRVQRVPVNDTKLQTSAATVAVLPESTDTNFDADTVFPPSDLRIDVYRASGAGGQHVNTTESAVRITHLPTGTVVAIQDERSQHQNKAKAMRILAARINEMMRQKRLKERAKMVQSQVGTGDRSERIRTYNFPQDRITDHRLQGEESTKNGIMRLMNGEIDALDEFLDSLALKEVEGKLLSLLEAER